MPTHFKNNALVNSLLKNNLLDDLSTKRVDCLITVGNFSLSKRIYTALNKVIYWKYFSFIKWVEELDHLHSYLIYIFQIEMSTMKIILISFSPDWPNNLIICKNMFFHQCLSVTKDYTKLSNIYKLLRKIHQMQLFGLKTSHLSKLFL